jgi:hypothetical protein
MEKDLKELSNYDLIQELRGRGFRTDLLYCADDVDMQLKLINDDNEPDDLVTLDEMEKEQILDIVFDRMTDYVCEMINSYIQDEIHSYKID